MEMTQYREAVAANRREHGFEAVDEWTDEFEHLWIARQTDESLGAVVALATLVDAEGFDAPALRDTAAAFRDVLAGSVDAEPGRADGGASPTLIGYVTFAAPDPDASLIEAMSGFTVAERRTNVFPLVYDTAAEQLHRHEVPRLKGRGIYRRQAEDAERLFDV
ncbi:hypothetical protein C464_13340 [Halorubrum coriense DSM 10284]|uniref:Uncharacterized protein n=1 Tax=Halorubrum coriense DSM 10284 TaxID=1227466 RepID=M0EBT5_9EURY|nr:hypothetical protein [Halorubrum coriense]ELZ44483.1 hypothetical protein C464_13340 [Halorubrum coriense DSM 10284]